MLGVDITSDTVGVVHGLTLRISAWTALPSFTRAYHRRARCVRSDADQLGVGCGEMYVRIRSDLRDEDAQFESV